MFILLKITEIGCWYHMIHYFFSQRSSFFTIRVFVYKAFSQYNLFSSGAYKLETKTFIPHNITATAFCKANYSRVFFWDAGNIIKNWFLYLSKMVNFGMYIYRIFVSYF